MSDLKYMTGAVKTAGQGGFDAVISTPKVDLDMEVVLPGGLINRDAYMTNPLVYWAHEWVYNPSAEPIGKATRLDVHDDRIESSADYAPTAKAQNIRALVSGGFVRKTSIGFDSLEMAEIAGIPTHTRWALREYSVVPMPANTDASITGVKSALTWLAEQLPDTKSPMPETEAAMRAHLERAHDMTPPEDMDMAGMRRRHSSMHDGGKPGHDHPGMMAATLPDYKSTNIVIPLDANRFLAALDVAGWTLDSDTDGLTVNEHRRVIARIAKRRVIRSLS